MKAALLTTIGDHSSVTLDTITLPSVSKDEVLIRVLYCGVNHLDLLIKQGKRPGPMSFPHVLGSEIVGIVEELKGKKKGLQKGDTVAVYPWTFCAACSLCTSGNENICDAGGTIGRTRWGGYAENVIVPIRNLIKIPRNLSIESVCTLTLTGTTAYHLVNRALVKNNRVVLVTGATGGVGTLVIQILRHMNCTILATTSHAEKRKQLKSIGVNHVIPTKSLVRRTRKIFPEGVNHVIDIMGGNVWSEAVDVLAKNGSMSFCATTLDSNGSVAVGSAFSREINLHGSYGGTMQDLRMIIKLLQRGVVDSTIDSTYPLQKANDALQRLDEQKSFGKILLKVTS